MHLPLEPSTPYQQGTTSAHAARTSKGQPVVVATFGNTFSEHVLSMTPDAARDLRDALMAAIQTADEAR